MQWINSSYRWLDMWVLYWTWNLNYSEMSERWGRLIKGSRDHALSGLSGLDLGGPLIRRFETATFSKLRHIIVAFYFKKSLDWTLRNCIRIVEIHPTSKLNHLITWNVKYRRFRQMNNFEQFWVNRNFQVLLLCLSLNYFEIILV